MAEAGRIYGSLTKVEIDESGVIWLVQNYLDSESVIIDMEASSSGRLDNSALHGYLSEFDYYEEELEPEEFEDDYL